MLQLDAGIQELIHRRLDVVDRDARDPMGRRLVAMLPRDQERNRRTASLDAPASRTGHRTVRRLETIHIDIACVSRWVNTTQPNPQAAASFYAVLFGWELQHTMPP